MRTIKRSTTLITSARAFALTLIAAASISAVAQNTSAPTGGPQGPAPTSAPSGGLRAGAPLLSNLLQGDILVPGQVIVSTFGTHKLVNDAATGTLQLFNTATGQKTWTSAAGAQGANALLNYSGALELWGQASAPAWTTGTVYNSINERLTVQDDGNLVIYQPASVLWASNTNNGLPNAGGASTPYSANSGHWNPGTYMTGGDSLYSSSGTYRLTMLADGNLVLQAYVPATAAWSVKWSSNTQGHPGAYATMQTDGNLVVYVGNPSNQTPIWHSQSWGHAGASLLLQDDGNAVIYTWKPVWASNTFK